jgi:NDP-sugar pyrophosphorylase family protein
MVERVSVDLSKIPLVILAGGKATRLGALSKDLPKYLMPVSATETFADVHLRWAFNMGFRKIILSVSYLADQVRKHVKDGSQYGLQVEYIEDGAEPAGTGGALRPIKAKPPEFFCLTYGDTLLNFSVRDCVTDFVASKKTAAITVLENKVPGHVANIRLNAANAYYDKKNPKPDMHHIDYGFLAFRGEFLQKITDAGAQDLADPLHALSLEKDLFGFEVYERFWEIGSPEALSEFQARGQSSKE